ncbi:MAG: nicotinamide-nucleotide amidohydrolase family protein [Gammaproteobacteria bacterium]|jgi:nicotinamide-nucleotide amidase
MDVAQRVAARVGEALKQRGFMLVTAESCTGGWVAKVVTSVAGSSLWFDRGFVSYSNVAKQEMLDVKSATLKDYGAVSDEVVQEMALGALAHSAAQVSVAISGIAGPEGGTPTKPVGTVCLAWCVRNGIPRSRATHFAGDREMIRQQAVMAALQGVLDELNRVESASLASKTTA